MPCNWRLNFIQLTAKVFNKDILQTPGELDRLLADQPEAFISVARTFLETKARASRTFSISGFLASWPIS